jgi:hypothetical protein
MKLFVEALGLGGWRPAFEDLLSALIANVASAKPLPGEDRYSVEMPRREAIAARASVESLWRTQARTEARAELHGRAVGETRLEAEAEDPCEVAPASSRAGAEEQSRSASKAGRPEEDGRAQDDRVGAVADSAAVAPESVEEEELPSWDSLPEQWKKPHLSPTLARVEYQKALRRAAEGNGRARRPDRVRAEPSRWPDFRHEGLREADTPGEPGGI